MTQSDPQRDPYVDRPIVNRPDWQLPGDARVAVYVGLNVEVHDTNGPGPTLIPALANRAVDPINSGWRDYGPAWGSGALASCSTTSASLPACCSTPTSAPRIRRSRPTVPPTAGAGSPPAAATANSPDPSPRTSTATPNTPTSPGSSRDITAATGQRLHGWLGPLGLSQTPNTVGLLSELGFRCVLDWSADDQPFALADSNPISVPYSFEINDLPPLMRSGLTDPRLGQMIIDQFHVLYAEGGSQPRVLPMAIHPFVAGQAFRATHEHPALKHITEHDHVWLCTSDELADRPTTAGAVHPVRRVSWLRHPRRRVRTAVVGSVPSRGRQVPRRSRPRRTSSGAGPWSETRPRPAVGHSPSGTSGCAPRTMYRPPCRAMEAAASSR